DPGPPGESGRAVSFCGARAPLRGMHASTVTALAIAVLASSAGCATAVDRHESSFVVPIAVLDVRWRRHLTEEPPIEYKPQEFAAAESDGEHVYVGSSSGYLNAFAASDGRLLWRRHLDGAIAARPLLLAGERTVYVGTLGGSMVALDAVDGRE